MCLIGILFKKYSDTQLSGSMLPKSAKLWNSEQDTSYVAIKWFSRMTFL